MPEFYVESTNILIEFINANGPFDGVYAFS